jgi:mRNA-degrading endonuclease RelE of RelBE toxin-antitoxin system
VAYDIEVTTEANLDLAWLRRFEEQTIRASLERYLAHEPERPSRKRKRMQPNPLGAEWALRLGSLRAYYEVDQTTQTVLVLSAGRKVRNQVVIRGVAYDLREGEEGGTLSEEEP